MYYQLSSGSWGRGWEGSHAPPPPVKNSHKKDGRQARQFIFHVSWPPSRNVSGSATTTIEKYHEL